MSLFIKPNRVKFKSGDKFVGANAVAEKSTAELVKDVKMNLDKIVTDANKAIQDANTALEEVKSERDALVKSITDALETGTDTTLTLAGVPADAKATGDKLSELKDELVQLENNTFVSVVEHINENNLESYVDAVFENGYYDINGDFTETEGYKNWQINTKESNYTIGFGDTEGYVQMSVFSGIPSKNTYVGRYRPSDGNLPSVENPMIIPKGYVVVIATITYSVTSFNVFLSYVNGVKFNDARVEEIKNIAKSIEKKKYIKYVNSAGENSSTERLEIYIPMKVGYLMYNFVRSVSSSDNCDVWRISSIKARNDDLSSRYDLSSNGEWECAIRLNGRDDFAGGYMHGDEVYANMTVFVDGIETSRFDLTALTEFEEIVITEKASLYDPNDHTTIVADHGSKHVWTDKLIIEQTITWRDSYQLDPSYLAMYPPLKTVTAKWHNNIEYRPKVISLPQKLKGCTSVTLYDTEKGFYSCFEVSKYPSIFDTEGYFFISDNGGNPYNKCYYAVVDYNSSVKTSEIWNSITEYKFEIAK